MPLKNMRDCSVFIQDGTETPNEIELAYSDGNFKYSVARNIQQILDRGRLSELKLGNDAPIEGSFSKKYDQMIAKTTDANPSPYEAMMGIGAAAHWTSTSNYCGVYTFRLKLKCYDECAGEYEVTTFEKCFLKKTDVEEAEESNKQAFEFMDWETEPTVTWEAA